MQKYRKKDRAIEIANEFVQNKVLYGTPINIFLIDLI